MFLEGLQFKIWHFSMVKRVQMRRVWSYNGFCDLINISKFGCQIKVLKLMFLAGLVPVGPCHHIKMQKFIS